MQNAESTTSFTKRNIKTQVTNDDDDGDGDDYDEWVKQHVMLWPAWYRLLLYEYMEEEKPEVGKTKTGKSREKAFVL